jgi:mutator protein MutT
MSKSDDSPAAGAGFPATGPVLEVAAALVFREGKLLITQRPAGGHLAGLWEFPGGKREGRETFERCLARELREELGIEVEVGSRVATVTHEYPDKAVYIEFFRCRWTRYEPQPLGCPDFRWVTASELDSFAFPAADAQVIQKLLKSPEWWT